MTAYSNDHLEIEVKFFIKDTENLRKRLLDLNCVSKGRVFEKNIRFDDKHSSLLKNKSLLRLRRDNRNLLTYKSTPAIQDTDVKVMTEYEVEVSDDALMQKILFSLGFLPVQQYEKWRETFCLDHTELLIDALPYGNFLEIEGEKAHIRTLAAALELDWDKRILLNYLAMFDIIRTQMDLSFSDVTFAHFASLELDITPFLPMFHATPKKT